MLIGSGECARRIAEAILTRDANLIIASAEDGLGLSPNSISIDKGEKWDHVHTYTKVQSCQGAVGDFRVVLECDGQKKIAAVDKIIIAEDEQRIPCFSAYGLTRTDKIMALSQLEKQLHENPEKNSLSAGIKTVVFLVGMDTESNPFTFERIMQSCLRLRALHRHKIYVLTCHEGNCHSARGSGYVQQRVDRISELFRPIGLEGGRLIKKTLASNMGVEFAGALVDFEKQLLEMGPLRLKSGKK